MATEDNEQGAEMGTAVLAFTLTDELRDRTIGVLEEVRAGGDLKVRSAAMAALVVDLTQAGLDYYFLRPLKKAEVGFVNLNTARIGLASAGKSIPLVINKIIKSVDERQLLAIADYVDELLQEKNG